MALVFKVVAKLKYLVAIISGHVLAWLPPIVRFMTKQNSISSKALIMPLTKWNCVLSQKHLLVQWKSAWFFKKLLSYQNFQVATFCYPHFLTCSNSDFQVANLHFATVNFEPYYLWFLAITIWEKWRLCSGCTAAPINFNKCSKHIT